MSLANTPLPLSGSLLLVHEVVLIEHGYASIDCEREIIAAAGGELIDAEKLGLSEALRLCEEADAVRFPGLHLSWQALLASEGTTAVLNASNEVAVAAFLERRLAFDRIHAVNLRTLETLLPPTLGSLDDLLALDAQAREIAHTVARQWQL